MLRIGLFGVWLWLSLLIWKQGTAIQGRPFDTGRGGTAPRGPVVEDRPRTLAPAGRDELEPGAPGGRRHMGRGNSGTGTSGDPGPTGG